ncbi:MAG: histidinol-phosphatase [Anaerolineales bacterium]|nr:histidinol-phosphatase [Anaerolineales bacterium]
MIPLDYHMHSSFSEDGASSPEKMCRQAIKLGLPEIGFTEHWDVGPFEKNPRFFQPEPWYAELERLRDLFAGKLTIRAGIEVAEPHLYPQPAAEVLTRTPFDYVLGSVHFVGPHFMFDEAYFRAHTADEVYLAYFAEVETLLQTADLDILAHLDLPVRTAKPIFGYDPTRYKDQIHRILHMVIDRNLALDVNTAGLRKAAQNLMPDPLILKWYAEMGGERITLGSDAHAASQVGLHLDAALEAVRAVGISNDTQFERRQAHLISL